MVLVWHGVGMVVYGSVGQTMHGSLDRGCCSRVMMSGKKCAAAAPSEKDRARAEVL